MYYYGMIVKQDSLKAKELLTKSCNYKYTDACIFLGDAHLKDKNYKEAIRYYFKSSTPDEINGYAYFQIAVMYQEGLGTKKNIEDAIEFYAEACIAGIPQGCDNVNMLVSKQ